MLARLRQLLIVLAAAWTLPAFAAPCANFTDIDDTHPFCPSVDWLKNRAITLGCTPSTMFCPNQDVIRLSMAAFMNRLGKVLTPLFLYDASSGASLDLDAAMPPICETGDLAATAYPRQAEAASALTAEVGATPAAVDLSLVISSDGGATWTALNANPATFAGAGRILNAAVFKTGVALVAGTTYRFGLAASRSTSATTTGDLGDWNCQLRLIVRNRTGTSAPF